MAKDQCRSCHSDHTGDDAKFLLHRTRRRQVFMVILINVNLGGHSIIFKNTQIVPWGSKQGNKDTVNTLYFPGCKYPLITCNVRATRCNYVCNCEQQVKFLQQTVKQIHCKYPVLSPAAPAKQWNVSLLELWLRHMYSVIMCNFMFFLFLQETIK